MLFECDFQINDKTEQCATHDSLIQLCTTSTALYVLVFTCILFSIDEKQKSAAEKWRWSVVRDMSVTFVFIL